MPPTLEKIIFSPLADTTFPWLFVADDYVLPYKEERKQAQSKQEAIESSPTLEELPKLRPSPSKKTILLKNISKKSPEKPKLSPRKIPPKDSDCKWSCLQVVLA